MDYFHPGGWIPARARFLMLATRPWSVPASLVPAVLAVAVVWGDVAHVADAILPAAGVILLHLFGNVINTYFDFKKGLDTAATADDRALVDRTVTQSDLLTIAILCLLSGGSLVGYYGYLLGPVVAALGAAGTLLAFFYTADPFSLKYWGLGDLVVFLEFGPLLTAGVSMAATRSPVLSPLALAVSLPVGALTVGILHANNTRDIAADRKAGAVTLAQALGFRGSFAFYVALFAFAYASGFWTLAVAISQQYGTQPLAAFAALMRLFHQLRASGTLGSTLLSFQLPRLVESPRDCAAALHILRAIVFLTASTLPWARALTSRFSARALRTLPQSTAQFTLYFGGCMFCGLLGTEALGRLLLGLLFYLGGFNNVLMWRHTSLLVQQKLPQGLPGWVTAGAAGAATGMQLVASALFILGLYPRLAAVVLLCFLIPVTVSVHDFWGADYALASEIVPLEAVSLPPATASAAISAPVVDSSDNGKKEGRSASSSATPGRSRARSVAVRAKSSSSSSAKSRADKRAVAAAEAAPAPPASAAVSADGAEAVASAAEPASASSSSSSPFRPDGRVKTFLDDFSAEFVGFFKNVMAIGGLLLYLALA